MSLFKSIALILVLTCPMVANSYSVLAATTEQLNPKDKSKTLKLITGDDLDHIQSQALPGFRFADSKIADIVSFVMPLVFAVAGLLLLLYIVSAGYSLMTSGADPKALEVAKGKLIHALTGFFIVFLSFWIVQIISLILGLPAIFNMFSPTPL